MALSNYERLKLWRVKHPYRAKEKRKEYRERKKNLSGSVESRNAGSDKLTTESQDAWPKPSASGVSVPPAQSSPKQSIIESLRQSIKPENLPPPVTISIKPKIFYNDITGQVITEAGWKDLQKRKAAAVNRGYVLDEFSQ